MRGREMHTRFWKGKLKERVHLEYLGVDASEILNQTLKELAQDWENLQVVSNTAFSNFQHCASSFLSSAPLSPKKRRFV
jgi:hypothetical protein